MFYIAGGSLFFIFLAVVAATFIISVTGLMKNPFISAICPLLINIGVAFHVFFMVREKKRLFAKNENEIEYEKSDYEIKYEKSDKIIVNIIFFVALTVDVFIFTMITIETIKALNQLM